MFEFKALEYYRFADQVIDELRLLPALPYALQITPTQYGRGRLNKIHQIEFQGLRSLWEMVISL